jgi:hypothetical protein
LDGGVEIGFYQLLGFGGSANMFPSTFSNRLKKKEGLYVLLKKCATETGEAQGIVLSSFSN